jgi:hypothetical protein
MFSPLSLREVVQALSPVVDVLEQLGIRDSRGRIGSEFPLWADAPDQ